jgi:Methyltransferase domain
MDYVEFLAALHERLEPRTYLEIGVAQGHSLGVARCRSIGVDPEFLINQELLAPVSLLRCTSDEYFERLDAAEATPFGELPIDLTYIDGMHHFEYALRDFIGAERYSSSSGVIAFDDVLPRNVEEAARGRATLPWTGDVFRIRFALASHRPDLKLVLVNTDPTGTLLVANLDPASTVLTDRLDEIVRKYVQADPQPIPAEVLSRTKALSPKRALSLKLWDKLRAERAAQPALD